LITFDTKHLPEDSCSRKSLPADSGFCPAGIAHPDTLTGVDPALNLPGRSAGSKPDPEENFSVKTV